MTSYPAVRDPNRSPSHPGEILREDVIPSTGKSKAEIARLLGISRQHLYDILNEKKPITAAVAVRVGKLLVAEPASGCVCRRPTTHGMPSARST